jgi:hypothetical protein
MKAIAGKGTRVRSITNEMPGAYEGRFEEAEAA